MSQNGIVTGLVALFWNRGQRRVRMVWRLIALFLLLLFFNFLLGRLAFSFGGYSPSFVVFQTVSAVSSLLSLLVAGRVLDRRPFTDFGFHLGRVWWEDFAFGIGLGAFLMSGIFLAEWALGWVTVVDTRVSPPGESLGVALLLAFWLFVCVAFTEEGLTRGYLLRNLAEGFRWRFISARTATYIAWLLSSAVFGLMHMGNPHVTPQSLINLVFAGLFLGLGFILTGELALPLGVHWAWNFFQGNVFGFPVSGVAAVNATTLIAIRQEGPAFWTGGAFGPEGGMVSLIAVWAGMALVVLWTRRRQPLWAHARYLADA